MVGTILSIWTNDGFFALFNGLGPELTSGMLSAALMMVVKEKLQGAVRQLCYAVVDAVVGKSVCVDPEALAAGLRPLP